MPTVAERALESQATSDDPSEKARSTDVDLLTFIRQALKDTGWTYDALEAANVGDKGYISRVLSGEKPLSGSFLRSLPDDVHAIVATKYAEVFGLIVVAPVNNREAAVRALASGLFGMLTAPTLPARAEKMARATSIGVRRKKVG